MQVEFGTTLSSERVSGLRETSYSVPEILLRVGLSRAVEARVGFLGWMRTSVSGGGQNNGFGDVSLGAKVRVLEGDGSRPEIALLGTAIIPTGAVGFRAERVDPELRVAVGHDLSDRISFGYNAGVALTGVAEGFDIVTDADALYTAALGIGLSDRIGAFIEAFGAFPLEDGRAAQHSIDGGLTFLHGNRIRFDVGGGVGLTDAADDWFVLAGVSVRLPR